MDAEKSEVSVIGDVSRESVGNQALYAHSTPIVAVVGMQSKLGKADLELQLCKTLQDKGYDTAMFMSEPYYKLFQQKYGWINGFGTETIDWEKEIVGANYLMHKLDDEQHEIVVVGTQSQVIPMAYENIGFLPQGTQDILIATHPDAFILVISEQSTEKQITRTISYLESYFMAPVLAIYSINSPEKVGKHKVLISKNIDILINMVIDFFANS